MKEVAMKESYSAANVFPAKLLHTDVLTEDGRIKPIHIQLSPTNKCTLNCPFCSCSARDKKIRMPYQKIMRIMKSAKRCGCLAVTITGGGEPLCHPKIAKIVKNIDKLGIKIGLVTNGTLVYKFGEDFWKHITWCRISSGDHRAWTLTYALSLLKAVKAGRNVDWAFSHVLSKNPNYELLEEVINFANNNNFTHVRIVSDLLDVDNVPDMDTVKRELNKKGIKDDLVIYQGRKKFKQGRKVCLISLLKPVIGTNGRLYPCCGTQYAQANPSRDFVSKIGDKDIMSMGDATSRLGKNFRHQRQFDGSVCARCYYDDYNEALKILTSKIKHKEFV